MKGRGKGVKTHIPTYTCLGCWGDGRIGVLVLLLVVVDSWSSCVASQTIFFFFSSFLSFPFFFSSLSDVWNPSLGRGFCNVRGEVSSSFIFPRCGERLAKKVLFVVAERVTGVAVGCG